MDYGAADFWEHREQFHWNTRSTRYRPGAPSALPGAQSSSSGALWRVRAHTAALVGAHTAEQIIQ